MSRVMLPVVCVAAILLMTAARSAQAGDCCDHCGCQCNLQKYCKLVQEVKKVPKISYDVKCEDICLHGHSHKCGCEWIPSCGRIKTVKKLVKIETTCEVPAYKCVVVTVCCDCRAKLAAAEEQDGSLVDQPQLACKPSATQTK